MRKKSALAALKGFMHRIRAQLIARAARSNSQITAVAARNANISEVKPYSLRALDEMDDGQPGAAVCVPFPLRLLPYKLWKHYLPRSFIPRYRYFLNGLIASTWILAVPTRRRSELGNYVGRLSLQSSWDLAVKKKKVKSIKNGDLILMAFGIATLTALNDDGG
ncbi:unnamed protein product [Tilletia controversa]|nr:unnamed protein product [Tilletia controversa]